MDNAEQGRTCGKKTQFNVFTTPCASGEDPYYTRRDDVLEPSTDYTDRAFVAVLPFYQLEKERDIAKTVKIFRSQIMNLQEYDGKKLVTVMKEVNPGASAFPLLAAGSFNTKKG